MIRSTELVTRAGHGAELPSATGRRPPHRDDWMTTMANKDNQKANTKKVGKTLKEKRSAKKAKAAGKATSHIPSTGH